MPKTFSGDAVWITKDPETLVGAPILNTSASKDSDAKATSKAKASSDKNATATAKDKSEAKETAKDSSSPTSAPTSSPKNAPTTLNVATSSPAASGSAIAATASAAISATASPTGAASGGMSVGAKAGLVLALLVGLALILGVVLFIYHRKKKALAAQKRIDDEKSAMQMAPSPPAVHVQPAPSIRTERTLSTAPRLSLRPVTQFSPTFENRKSGGNLLTIAAAAPASQSRDRTPSPHRPSSSWERPGAANVEPTHADPFSDPRPETPAKDPFANPSPPQSFLQPTAPASTVPRDFANPAAAIAAAEAAPIAVAAAPIARKALPTPAPEPAPIERSLTPDFPLPNVNHGSVPPSPAWTDDFPASPGPAPTGPPPTGPPGMVAGGMANGHGPAPAPNNVHRVQLDFKPSMKDELGLHAGQLVRMLHEYDDGWALCIRMDRSQQGVVPRTCLSKHPVKPRTGPPRQGPPGPRMRSPPIASPMAPSGVPRPLTPSSGRNSPMMAPPNGRMSPAPRSMSPGPRAMAPGPRAMSPGPRSMSPGPNRMSPPGGRARSNSNAPYAGQPRSMSPGPYGGGPQYNMPPPQMGRPRSNSASQVNARRAPAPGPSPMNPNAASPMPQRKPIPGMAL
ncbi:hypothetical protein P154DRAFT_423304 [Amniculicola lignicola CBS 123094]|uniref:SH3 domain-containing protein n=1 Tax=Amniculicola lignicola CBS 123094 TaxID=1392246 RepID=A0A6A5WVN5_9PLEO|nr:hypothetical protein P154DRAFT_423304 [Amniculicola lignicola CBS 123094]